MALFPAFSQALVNSGNPGGNTTAPTGEGGQPEDPGFASMVTVRGGAAAYLGNGWLLTARHISPAWVLLDGEKVPREGLIDKQHRFKNAELLLFHINRELDLPPVRIATSTPPPGTEVVMISSGRISQDHMSYYQVDRSTNPWGWQEQPSAEGANAAGILTIGGQKMSWGTNRISGLTKNPSMGELLVTDFSDSPPQQTAFEAQAVSRDSGGALFVETDEGWVLTGIMATVARLYPGQPGVVKPEKGGLAIGSGFYGNLTFSVNLAPYRDEILKVTGLSSQ